MSATKDDLRTISCLFWSAAVDIKHAKKIMAAWPEWGPGPEAEVDRMIEFLTDITDIIDGMIDK